MGGDEGYFGRLQLKLFRTGLIGPRPRGRRADRQGRRQVIQCLSQQCHRQPRRCPGRRVSGNAAHHRRGFVSCDGALTCAHHTADSPLLFEYGHDFPDFVQGYEHAQSLPWLADVARMERAWLDAYHAAAAQPLAPQSLASIPPERLVGTVLTPHPTTRILRSRFPAVTIFAANRRPDPVSWIEASEPEDGLVTRPALEVFVRHLPPGGAAILADLIAGQPLGLAAAAALADCPDFDLPANIAGMLDAGAFTACHEGPDHVC